MKSSLKIIFTIVAMAYVQTGLGQIDTTETSFDLAHGVYKKQYTELGKVNVGPSDFAKVNLNFQYLEIREILKNHTHQYLHMTWTSGYGNTTRNRQVSISCSEVSDLIKFLEYVKIDLTTCKNDCEYVFVGKDHFKFSVYNSKNNWNAVIESGRLFDSKLFFQASKLSEIRAILESFIKKCT